MPGKLLPEVDRQFRQVRGSSSNISNIMIPFILSSLALLAAIALYDRRTTNALRRVRPLEVRSQGRRQLRRRG